MLNVNQCQQISVDEIMDRLSRLCRMGTCIHVRSSFPSGPAKWYVDMRGVRMPFTLNCYSGATPEEAIRNTWDTITDETKQSIPFVRYFCEPKESVPGKGPQVWVRWSNTKDDWEDVAPPADDWWASEASKIRPYAEHKHWEKSD